MEVYELRKENALGNREIATFRNKNELLKYVTDNTLELKYRYYVVVVETCRTKKSIELFVMDAQVLLRSHGCRPHTPI